MLIDFIQSNYSIYHKLTRKEGRQNHPLGWNKRKKKDIEREREGEQENASYLMVQDLISSQTHFCFNEKFRQKTKQDISISWMHQNARWRCTYMHTHIPTRSKNTEEGDGSAERRTWWENPELGFARRSKKWLEQKWSGVDCWT